MTPTHEEFLRDVAGHKMVIALDQGWHKSIRFGVMGSSHQAFQLNTWPGALCISGDMGCCVFERATDMLGFFRDADGSGRINPSYWAEKIVAQDGARAFSRDVMAKVLREESAQWTVTLGDASKTQAEVNELIAGDYSNEYEAFEAITGFKTADGNIFGYLEHDLKDWSYHFIWLLRAIVWGISQYDAAAMAQIARQQDQLTGSDQ